MPLESHKLASSSFAESEAEGDLEEYEDGICRIKIVQKPGFVCSLNASARLPMPFEKAWEVLCHPDNAAIFRHIDECIYRHVLVNEYPLMSFEVIHEASYKFLLFRGNFRTRLHVDEDHAVHESSFRLLKMQGLFKEFQGKWRVQEDTKGSAKHCILRLEQSLALSLPMPPPFDKILKYITCRQVRAIFDDLLQEAVRIMDNNPTLCSYTHDVALKEIELKEAEGNQKKNEEISDPHMEMFFGNTNT